MNVLDKVLDRANKFLENHIFEVHYLRNAEGELTMPTNVKVQLTGFKNYISIGNTTVFTEYTLFILPTNEYSDLFLGILRSHHGSESKINTPFLLAYHELRWVMDRKLDNLLKYFSLPESICTKIINQVESYKMNESIITEARYDNVVRTLVKDIISLYKFQREGEFSLPEDIRGEEDMTYSFPEFKNEFSIDLNLAKDDDVNTVEVDAAYYRDEDIIEVTIVSNPELGNQNIQELIGELNETIRHELEHVSQYQKGYDFPKEPKNPLKYYIQPHELEAQLAGFKRRSRKENRDLEVVIRGWFRRNEKRHRLKPKQVEIVINKLLEMS